MVNGKSSHCLWQGEIRRGVNNRKHINLGILYGQQQTHELNNPTYIHYNLDTCTWNNVRKSKLKWKYCETKLEWKYCEFIYIHGYHFLWLIFFYS